MAAVGGPAAPLHPVLLEKWERMAENAVDLLKEMENSVRRDADLAIKWVNVAE